VRVRGMAHATPMLEFIGRAGVVGDFCGEKLTEAFVSQVLERVALRFAALAMRRDGARGYVLLLDATDTTATGAAGLAAKVEDGLRANPQYAYARDLRQLAPVEAVRCSQPLQAWIDTGLRRGQRLGDIKPPALHMGEDWRETFKSLP